MDDDSIVIEGYSDPSTTGGGDFDHETCGVRSSYYEDLGHPISKE